MIYHASMRVHWVRTQSRAEEPTIFELEQETRSVVSLEANFVRGRYSSTWEEEYGISERRGGNVARVEEAGSIIVLGSMTRGRLGDRFEARAGEEWRGREIWSFGRKSAAAGYRVRIKGTSAGRKGNLERDDSTKNNNGGRGARHSDVDASLCRSQAGQLDQHILYACKSP